MSIIVVLLRHGPPLRRSLPERRASERPASPAATGLQPGESPVARPAVGATRRAAAAVPLPRTSVAPAANAGSAAASPVDAGVVRAASGAPPPAGGRRPSGGGG